MGPHAKNRDDNPGFLSGSRLEAEWNRLKRQIELTESGYWLVFVFVGDGDEARMLRARTLGEFARQGGTSKIIVPETQKQLATLGLKLLSPDVVGQSCVWVEALQADPVGQTASPWGDAWKELLVRLNERRDSLQRHLAGSLFLVLPAVLKSEVREMAPDLWAGRALVLDLPALESVETNVPNVAAFGELVTINSRMRQVLELARSLARSRFPILLEGETGTGKTLLAEDIHKESGVVGPFIAIHCGTISPNLWEATLFGNERGAYTGALSTHRGIFEQADGGTLFLDEIGLLAPAVQAALLSVVERQHILRVGSSKMIAVQVRIIVATNKDLPEEIAAGRFREDLYYRLHGFSLRIPPLRERPEDIRLLAERFLGALNVQNAPVSIGPDAMSALLQYRWPGNVRELQSVLGMARLRMGNRTVLTAQDLPVHIVPTATPSLNVARDVIPAGTLEEQMARAEIDILRSVLRACNGDRSEAAKRLGISDTTLWRRLQRYHAELEDIITMGQPKSGN